MRSNPMVAPIYVLYGTEAGDFAEAVALTNRAGKHLMDHDGEPGSVSSRICAEPFAYDLDADGDLDFVIGNFDGHFLVSMNVGTKEEPAFEGTATYLTDTAGVRLKLQGGNHGAPFLVDWDGDGDADLISGTGRGGVQIAENDPAEDGTPRFAAFRSLLEAPTGRGGPIVSADAPITMGNGWRVRVADYNADGKLDLIVGDCLRRSIAKEGLTVEEASIQQAAWTRERNLLLAELRATQAKLQERRMRALETPPPAEDEDEAETTDGDEPVDGDDAEAEASEPSVEDLELLLQGLQGASREHYKKRTEFVDAVATGHVWVYLQK